MGCCCCIPAESTTCFCVPIRNGCCVSRDELLLRIQETKAVADTVKATREDAYIMGRLYENGTSLLECNKDAHICCERPWCYQQNILDADEERAQYYYEKAALNGHDMARYRLKRITDKAKREQDRKKTAEEENKRWNEQAILANSIQHELNSWRPAAAPEPKKMS